MEADPDLVDTFIPAAALFERTAIDLAHLWREQGRVDEARQVLKEIYAWFSEGFDTLDLREARELCSEIS